MIPEEPRLKHEWPEDTDDLLDRLPPHTRNKVLKQLGAEPTPQDAPEYVPYKVKRRDKLLIPLYLLWASLCCAIGILLCFIVPLIPFGLLIMFIGIVPLGNKVYNMIFEHAYNNPQGNR